MPSQALIKWQTDSAERLEELLSAHERVGGTQRGRRYATRQLNASIVVHVAAHLPTVLSRPAQRSRTGARRGSADLVSGDAQGCSHRPSRARSSECFATDNRHRLHSLRPRHLGRCGVKRRPNHDPAGAPRATKHVAKRNRASRLLLQHRTARASRRYLHDATLGTALATGLHRPHGHVRRRRR